MSAVVGLTTATLAGGDLHNLHDPSLVSTATDDILLFSKCPPSPALSPDLKKGDIAFDIPLRQCSRRSVFNPYDMDGLSEEEDKGYRLVPANSRSSQESAFIKDRTPVALARAVSRLQKDPTWHQLKAARRENFIENEKEENQGRNGEGKEMEEAIQEPISYPEIEERTLQLYPGVLDPGPKPKQLITQPETKFGLPSNTIFNSYYRNEGEEEEEEEEEGKLVCHKEGKEGEGVSFIPHRGEEKEKELVSELLEKGKDKELDTFSECNPAPSNPSPKASMPVFERGTGPAPGEEGNLSKEKGSKSNGFLRLFSIGSKGRGTKYEIKTPKTAEEKKPAGAEDGDWSQKSKADLRTMYKAKKLALQEVRTQLAALRSNARTLEGSIESIRVEMASRDAQIPMDSELFKRGGDPGLATGKPGPSSG